MTKVVIIDKKDRPLGTLEKLTAHKTKNLHRAFSVFIFNDKKELLLQQRSRKKLLWPMYWSNTCCSHPGLGEDYKIAARRRLEEEFGFTCSLYEVGRFQYQAKYKNIGYEYETCAVFTGRYDGRIKPDKDEINGYKWMEFSAVKKDIDDNPQFYTPWFKKEIKKFGSRFFKNKKYIIKQ